MFLISVWEAAHRKPLQWPAGWEMPPRPSWRPDRAKTGMWLTVFIRNFTLTSEEFQTRNKLSIVLWDPVKLINLLITDLSSSTGPIPEKNSLAILFLFWHLLSYAEQEGEIFSNIIYII